MEGTMNRQNALVALTPGQQLKISEKQLGAFFCTETFAFVLDPRTRRAAERVARWHGCEFHFYSATGHSTFVKRGRMPGTLVSLFESAIQRLEHMISRAQRYTKGFELKSRVYADCASAG
jgi:hypothetical protein